MKKLNKYIVMAAFISLFFFFTSAGVCQDLKQLTEAINQLEKVVTKMVEKESQTRTAEIKKIKTQIEAMKELSIPAAVPGGTESEELRKMKMELDSLINYTEDLNNTTNKKIEEIDSLAKGLAGLVEKFQQLLNQLEKKSAPAAVEEKKKEYGVKLSGTIFANYNWDYAGVGKEKDANKMEVERLYITAKGDISDDFAVRATLDVYSSKADANLNSVYILKYGYVDWKAASWFTLRGGIIPTEWVGTVEDAWKYRGVAKVMSDAEGLQSSADVGISALAKFPSNMGDAVVMILNGDGYRKAESNRFKDIAGRVTINPFANQESVLSKFQLSAHYYAGRHAEGLRKNRWGVMAYLPHDYFSVAVNYDVRSDSSTEGNGFSIFGEIPLNSIFGLNNFSIIGRVDSFDPNTSVDSDKRTRFIYGLVYQANSKVTLVLNNQSVIEEKEVYKKYDGSFSKRDEKVFFNIIVSF